MNEADMNPEFVFYCVFVIIWGLGDAVTHYDVNSHVDSLDKRPTTTNDPAD